MATGRSLQLTRQIGEHLIAAKLGRMGYVAAPFAGNVPLFDLLAADQRGFTIPIQVKTINGPSWQYRADTFLEIEIVDDFQHIRGQKPLLNPDLVCIYILLRDNEQDDEFYIFSLHHLQQHTFEVYKGGKRPKNPASTHCAVWPRHLQSFRDNWQLIQRTFDKQRSEIESNARLRSPTTQRSSRC
jgi:hypothetical protein